MPIFLILASLIVAGAAQPAGAGDVSAGFIFDRYQLTLEAGRRTEAAGPFYYSEDLDSKTTWAIPPFFSDERDPGVERQEDDFFYPIFTKVRYGTERRWQFFQVLNVSSGENPESGEARRITIFPLYFQQRAADTNLNYTALVPFYGRLKNRFFRDEIYFIMLPGFVETRKRDRVIDNYLFPIVDVRHGDGMKGWQVWPFVGHEHKEITSATNGFGDVSLVPGHDHSFYLWPFYLRQDNGIGSANPEKFRALLPFCALSRSPQNDSTSVLWPFFTTIDDRAQKYHEWQAPWPFVILTRGENRSTVRFWPLYSHATNATRVSESILWPLYVYSHVDNSPLDEHRTRLLYYLYSRLSQKNTETGKERVRLDMWPFFTWHRELNGNERLQVIAPLEPAVPDNPGVERNWSPLWSFWRAEINPHTRTASQSLLWNLYRCRSSPGETEISAFFGLYQYRKQAGETSLRLFYIPLRHE